MLLLVPGSGSQDFCTQRSKQTVITNCHEAGRSQGNSIWEALVSAVTVFNMSEQFDDLGRRLLGN